MDTDVDCIVAGAGIVGLAIARSLAQGGREVLVLERGEHIGSETSSRNSEVIHAGVYYPKNSLKSTLCIRGRDLLYAYCEERSVAHARLGKLIVATRPEETKTLDAYLELAAETGVELVPRTPAEVAELEPELECAAALWSPATGIVDSHELMLSLVADVEAAGGMIVCHTEITGVGPQAGGIAVGTEDTTIAADAFVNSAGLGAQKLARATAGIDDAFIPPEHYAVGHYYTLVGRSPFSHLVYPTARSGGLGIHVTLDLAGQARFGPDVRWLTGVDYDFDNSRLDDFKASIADYYPGIRDRELAPGYTGIRPKVVGPGEPAGDFEISGEREHGVPGVVNLFGIESPGLTAALAIGEYVAAELS